MDSNSKEIFDKILDMLEHKPIEKSAQRQETTKLVEHIVLKPSANLECTAKFENSILTILTIKGTENE